MTSVRAIAPSLLVTGGLLVLACMWFVSASELPRGVGEPGPGFLPQLASIAMAGVLVAIGVSETVSALKEPPSSRQGEKISRRQLLLVACLCLYVVLLPVAGFLIATFALLTVVSKLFNVRGWVVPVVLSAAVTGATYLIFVEVLRVPLYSI